jgi:uncharacterized protein (DUF1015 family)
VVSLFNKTGFLTADILLPKKCDMPKWSVVACDQYTSQPEYWGEVEAAVGDAPSTFRLMLPEIYLGSVNESARIEDINAKMKNYIDGDVFKTCENSFIFVERTLKNGKIRRGLVGTVDLEAYDFKIGASTLIRATEGTVLSRIPPRMRVRENAMLEVPHVMLLIDDKEGTVIEQTTKTLNDCEKLYDFELMKDGGHIKGYRICGDSLESIANALSALTVQANFDKKYGTVGKPVMAYAVGDGNHSLATAKQCYEQLKKQLTPKAAANHPARYALVELVNIHDQSLEFEPIHRVVFDVDSEELIKAFLAYYPAARLGEGEGHRFSYCYAGGSGFITCVCLEQGLAASVLQSFLDIYLREHGGRVDYIHGKEVVKALSMQASTTGFLLPPMGKSELFRAVINDGVLPRKTFSMGEANDKRFYLECRRIK